MNHDVPYLSITRMRGLRNTVEIVLFEISNSMKPYPSVFHAYINNLRPILFVLRQTISMRFQTVFRQPLSLADGDEARGPRSTERGRRGRVRAPLRTEQKTLLCILFLSYGFNSCIIFRVLDTFDKSSCEDEIVEEVEEQEVRGVLATRSSGKSRMKR